MLLHCKETLLIFPFQIRVYKMALLPIHVLSVMSIMMLFANRAAGNITTVTTTIIYSNLLGGAPLTLVDTFTTTIPSAGPSILFPDVTCLSTYVSNIDSFLECTPGPNPAPTATRKTSVFTEFDTTTLNQTSTTTVTQAPVTITQIVSEVKSSSSPTTTVMTTSTALCFSGKDSVVEPCAEVYPVSTTSNSTKKSAAMSQMHNPFSILCAELKRTSKMVVPHQFYALVDHAKGKAGTKLLSPRTNSSQPQPISHKGTSSTITPWKLVVLLLITGISFCAGVFIFLEVQKRTLKWRWYCVAVLLCLWGLLIWGVCDGLQMV